mmetsp:Transcript_83240/g.138907  ORF Transcript_83240/g.138907 Transcript_83240/m.138907 type:complete len:89 (+) Transcript_83240:493-759(+)
MLTAQSMKDGHSVVVLIGYPATHIPTQSPEMPMPMPHCNHLQSSPNPRPRPCCCPPPELSHASSSFHAVAWIRDLLAQWQQVQALVVG